MATLEQLEALAIENVQMQFLSAAEEVARRICQVDPDNRIGRMVLAMAKGSTGRLEDARSDIDVALRGGSNDPQILHVARSVYQRTGDTAADAEIARRIAHGRRAPNVEFVRHHLRAGMTAYGWEIGEWSYGRPTILAQSQAKLRIGRFCSFGPEVLIYLGDNHRTDWITTYPFADIPFTWPEAAGITGHPATRGDVSIGHDVWLAHGAMVTSGVTIGNGAVIGARAVVIDDIPPYAIAVGNPARVVSRRFKQPQIETLQRLAWWDWPEARIRKAIPFLMNADIDGLAAFAEGEDGAVPAEAGGRQGETPETEGPEPEAPGTGAS